MSERTAQSGAIGPVFEPVIFTCEDRAIRAINDRFLVWVVAADVVEILGYSTVNHLMKAIDDDEKGTHTVGTIDGPRNFVTLSASGCYHAIFRSRKSNVRDIRRWIASTVVPETRRAGRHDGTPSGDTPSAGEPGDSCEPREADQLSMRFERVFTEAERMHHIRRNLMDVISRRVQEQVMLLRQFPRSCQCHRRYDPRHEEQDVLATRRPDDAHPTPKVRTGDPAPVASGDCFRGLRRPAAQNRRRSHDRHRPARRDRNADKKGLRRGP